jgi:predicted nucleic acid-binding protein
VIDASVALAAFFADERSAYTDSITRALSTGEVAYAPSIWPLEILNGLLVAERRKRLGREDVSQLVRFLDGFAIELDELGSLAAHTGDLQFARHFTLSVYDAAYLGVAQRRGLPLATVDKRLTAVAQSIGTSIYSGR